MRKNETSRITGSRAIMKRTICVLLAAAIAGGSMQSRTSLAAGGGVYYPGGRIPSKELYGKTPEKNKWPSYLFAHEEDESSSPVNSYSINLQKGTFQLVAKRMYTERMINPSFDCGPASVSYFYSMNRLTYKVQLLKQGKKIGKTYTLSFSESGDKTKNRMKTGKWKIRKNGSYRLKIIPVKRKMGSVCIDAYLINHKSKQL